MKRLISSELTLPIKVIVPLLFCGFLTQLLYVFIKLQKHDIVIALASTIVVGLVALYLGIFKLKAVSMDEHNFYISNHIRSITVPIKNLKKVSYSSWANFQPVRMHFHDRTEFGNSIKFMPELDLTPIWKEPPVVTKLNKIIEKGTGNRN